MGPVLGPAAPACAPQVMRYWSGHLELVVMKKKKKIFYFHDVPVLLLC